MHLLRFIWKLRKYSVILIAVILPQVSKFKQMKPVILSICLQFLEHLDRLDLLGWKSLNKGEKINCKTNLLYNLDGKGEWPSGGYGVTFFFYYLLERKWGLKYWRDDEGGRKEGSSKCITETTWKRLKGVHWEIGFSNWFSYSGTGASHLKSSDINSKITWFVYYLNQNHQNTSFCIFVLTPY